MKMVKKDLASPSLVEDFNVNVRLFCASVLLMLKREMIQRREFIQYMQFVLICIYSSSSQIDALAVEHTVSQISASCH